MLEVWVGMRVVDRDEDVYEGGCGDSASPRGDGGEGEVGAEAVPEVGGEEEGGVGRGDWDVGVLHAVVSVFVCCVVNELVDDVTVDVSVEAPVGATGCA